MAQLKRLTGTMPLDRELRRIGAMLLLLLLALLLAPALFGQSVPAMMNYQGRLTDNTPGQLPIDTTLPMTFRIYDAQTGGNLMWEESWSGVPVVEGIFSVMLGSAGSPIPPNAFTTGTSCFLEIVVDGELLTPRQRLGSVGFAYQAEQADRAADLDCVDCVGAGEIDADAVASFEIEDESITADDLAVGSVRTAEILDGGVHSADIDDDAISGSKIKDGSVGSADLDKNANFLFGGGVTFERSGYLPEWSAVDSGTPKLELYAETDFAYFYHPSSGSAFAVNDATGNWGINTPTPSTLFTVAGGSVTANSFVDGNNAAYYVDPTGASYLNLIYGTGAGITGLSASNIASGTLANARLDSSVAREDLSNVFLADQTISGGTPYLTFNSAIAGSGSGGLLMQEVGTSRWSVRHNTNVGNRFEIYSYGAPGPVMTVDYNSGTTYIEDLVLDTTVHEDQAASSTYNYSPTCPAGRQFSGGGCRCPTGTLEKSYPSGNIRWYCECSEATSVQAYSICLASTDP